jgi:outer membrane receptor protein involved in Fe transport
VRGLTAAEQLRESARAVKVVETTKAKRESADMGQVLARVEGVSVRRASGLGSEVRFSLNGLSGEQVRFFLDGVPLALAGYPSGLANVPVNLIERIEIYNGVVPIRFGADALGGAVNLVTDHGIGGSRVTGSYQVGSFGTHRLNLTARNLHEPTGFFARVEAFHDQSQNDYEVDVEVADALGRPYMARVPRFHDAYRASGGSLELGLVNRPYAKRLLARVFIADYDKEVQNNIVMAVPYGGVEFGETSYGASLRYEQPLSDDIELELLAGYTRSIISYLDVSECFYDWFGNCIDPDNSPGEIDGQPHDQLHYQNTFLGRANLSWQALPLHAFRASVSPTIATRTGDERRQADPNAPDPLAKDRTLTTLVGGVEWEADTASDVLENIAFAKAYGQRLRSDELVGGGRDVTRSRDTFQTGYGDSLRVRATGWLYFKASYEYATRLPDAYEVFGNGHFVKPSLGLLPERSHNANLGGVAEGKLALVGACRAGANLFLRDAHDQIVLVGDERSQSYQNVLSARSQGIEGSLGWTSPSRALSLDGNATYQSLRNTSNAGTFAPYEGDRLPNRPYFFANGSASYQLERLLAPRDSLALTWYTSYVHQFYRSWESIGRRDTKQVIDAQLTHSVALTHTLPTQAAKVSSTFEVNNLTNTRAYDYFGVQKPGRAFYVKTTLEL